MHKKCTKMCIFENFRKKCAKNVQKQGEKSETHFPPAPHLNPCHYLGMPPFLTTPSLTWVRAICVALGLKQMGVAPLTTHPIDCCSALGLTRTMAEGPRDRAQTCRGRSTTWVACSRWAKGWRSSVATKCIGERVPEASTVVRTSAEANAPSQFTPDRPSPGPFVTPSAESRDSDLALRKLSSSLFITLLSF